MSEIDLDALERAARLVQQWAPAARIGGEPPGIVTETHDMTAEAFKVLHEFPDVILALVARIRELEREIEADMEWLRSARGE